MNQYSNWNDNGYDNEEAVSETNEVERFDMIIVPQKTRVKLKKKSNLVTSDFGT